MAMLKNVRRKASSPALDVTASRHVIRSLCHLISNVLFKIESHSFRFAVLPVIQGVMGSLNHSIPVHNELDHALPSIAHSPIRPTRTVGAHLTTTCDPELASCVLEGMNAVPAWRAWALFAFYLPTISSSVPVSPAYCSPHARPFINRKGAAIVTRLWLCKPDDAHNTNKFKESSYLQPVEARKLGFSCARICNRYGGRCLRPR
jgi:hypothetical protein